MTPMLFRLLAPRLGRVTLLPILCLAVACDAPSDPSAVPAASVARKIALLEEFRGEFIEVKPDPAAEKSSGLASGFWMNKYEVPQDFYLGIMGSNPSRWRGRRNAVDSVNWKQATQFCRLTTDALRKQKLIREDQEIRLPTEREWEYVCRAGTKTAYSFGDDAGKLSEYGWFHRNAAGNDPEVGVKKPNAWGFYDMHGYLWEWCSDDVSEKASEREARPLRGGAWTAPAEQCRSDSRTVAEPTKSSPDIGFRCVLDRTRR